MQSRRYGFSLKILMQIVLLIGFSVFFIRAIVTGSVDMYVHPRIIPFMIFAAAALTIIAIFRLGDLFRPQYSHGGMLPLLFFLVPLLMAFAIPPQPFYASTNTVCDIQLAGGGSSQTGISKQQETQQEKQNSQQEKQEEEKIRQEEQAEPEISDDIGESGVVNGKNTLIMDSGNFSQYLNDVYGDIDSYVGMHIETVGFVFRDENKFADNEFVAARLMMVCCVADLQPVGFLCRYDGAETLKSDSWVSVSGTIEKTDYDGEMIPYIKADSIQPAEKPQEAYIYPY